MTSVFCWTYEDDIAEEEYLILNYNTNLVQLQQEVISVLLRPEVIGSFPI